MDRDLQIELMVQAQGRSEVRLADWDRDPGLDEIRRRQAEEARRQRALLHPQPLRLCR